MRNTVDLALETWKERMGERRSVHEMEKCDSLTQVASCPFGLHRLDEEVQRCVRFNHALSCLVVDIDRFAEVNREHGQVRGDRVLQDVASILTHGIRVTDVLARLEADRFLVIAPRMNAQAAQALADRLLMKLRRHRFPMPGRPPIELTATISAATCGGGPASDAFELLQRAFEAIARGKAVGGNQSVNG
jgi:diguanylate cyclase (GGDEF)-like protein